MAIDPITAIANAITGLANIAKPFIDDHIAQKYENEEKERLSEWNKLISENNPNHINTFVLRLINDAGHISSGVGENRSVSLDVINALIAITCGKIKDDQLLANIQFIKMENK